MLQSALPCHKSLVDCDEVELLEKERKIEEIIRMMRSFGISLDELREASTSA